MCPAIVCCRACEAERELVGGVGEEVRDGEREAEVKLMGFLATGGAIFDVELVVDVERRRSFAGAF